MSDLDSQDEKLERYSDTAVQTCCTLHGVMNCSLERNVAKLIVKLPTDCPRTCQTESVNSLISNNLHRSNFLHHFSSVLTWFQEKEEVWERG